MQSHGRMAVVVLLLAGVTFSAPPPLPRFEAVSIKQLAPGKLSPFGVGLFWIGLLDPGEWRARNQSLIYIVMSAYGIGQYERVRVDGLPPWARSAEYLYDIEARVPPQARAPQIPLMVQAMLADRFHMKAHWETRLMPAIALTVAPGGPKMQRDAACDDPDCPLALDLNPLVSGESPAVWQASKNPGGCGSWMPYQENGVWVRVYHGFTMQELAALYSADGDGRTPVVDRTQLAGAYDFTTNAPASDTNGLTPGQQAERRQQMLREMEQYWRKQFGLNIDFRKHENLPVPVLVIDQVEKPTAN